jgi:hypothetical protein
MISSSSGPSGGGSFIAPPTSVITFGLLRRILRTFKKYDRLAIAGQRVVQKFGVIYALLIPIAVLVLVLQITIFPSGGALAMALIILELLVLAAALVFLVCRVAPNSSIWACNRTRAEVLRREAFLVLGRLGPYLQCTTDSALKTEVHRRLEEIDNEVTDPDSFLPLRNSTPWRDELEDAGPCHTASPGPGFARLFLQKRIVGQCKWFQRKQVHFRSLDLRYERVVHGALIAALIVSAMHLILLLVCSQKSCQAQFIVLRTAAEVAAVVLPPIGTAAGALQSLQQGRRLAHSYRLHASELELLRRELERLIAAPPEDSHKYEFLLKRLALRTEELLSYELRTWFLVMQPM